MDANLRALFGTVSIFRIS